MIFNRKKQKDLPENMPGHVAIVMDGNGRWAKKRGLPRSAGHKFGFDNFVKTVDICSSAGVGYLTVYAFSTENWNRETSEVAELIKIMNSAIAEYVPLLMEKNISLKILGDLEMFDDESRAGLEGSVEKLKENKGMTLCVALSYGGRAEIIKAVNRAVESGEKVDETGFDKLLYTNGIPDPDLIIRTSGELRISNFLLWQSAYSEYYFTKTLWPDFDKNELYTAFEDYSKRKRRFGR